MRFLSFNMATANRGGIDKGDAGTSAQTHHLNKDSQMVRTLFAAVLQNGYKIQFRENP